MRRDDLIPIGSTVEITHGRHRGRRGTIDAHDIRRIDESTQICDVAYDILIDTDFEFEYWRGRKLITRQLPSHVKLIRYSDSFRGNIEKEKERIRLAKEEESKKVRKIIIGT